MVRAWLPLLVAAVALAGCVRPDGMLVIEAVFFPAAPEDVSLEVNVTHVHAVARDGLARDLVVTQRPLVLLANTPVRFAEERVPWDTWQNFGLNATGPVRVTHADGTTGKGNLVNRTGFLRSLVYPDTGTFLRVELRGATNATGSHARVQWLNLGALELPLPAEAPQPISS